MVRFPETVEREWMEVETKALAKVNVRKKIERETRVANEVETLRVRHEAKHIFQQELDAESTPVLEMMSMAEYQADPTLSPHDMIDGVMKENGLTLVLGPSRSGKSTLALQMLHCLLSGDDFLGQRVDKIDGGMGFLSYDMDASMAVDWMAGFPGIDASRVSLVNAYKRGNPVGVPAYRKKIAAAWKANKTEVVVLDSFGASFFGHDQNDAAAVMAHYRDMKLFALTEVGAKALIVIVHSTDANPAKPRGSTVHIDTADTIVLMAPEPTTGQRKVSIEKYRAMRGQSLTGMDPVLVSAPDNVTHLVDVDIAAMNLAGMPLPAHLVASAAFSMVPDPNEDPDLDSDSGMEDEDL